MDITLWKKRILMLCIGMAMSAGVCSIIRHNIQAVVAWSAATAYACGWYFELAGRKLGIDDDDELENDDE